MPSPIHLVEFAGALGRCLPRLSSPVIAVANSAGPDSTCLLFLLRQLFPPAALLSIHVLHHLQPATASMATVAAQNAHLLSIPHLALNIPWGVPPFPPAPTDGPVERVARDARYNILFHQLVRARVPLLALAHHADDQLETALMRLARRSSLTGAAGMRPSRRWGMGAGLSQSSLSWVGHQGLDTFLIRPLLPFPKDRILATCHVNRLNYVNDPSNALPHLTPRNAIRHGLCHDPPFAQHATLPLVSLDNLRDASLFLQSFATDVVGPKQRLHAAVKKLAVRSENIDRQVTALLDESVLPSPTSTLLLSSPKLLDITDLDVCFALVLRVMRYVSFHPWGSPRADADRRSSSVHRILRALWTPNPQVSRIKKFTAGGGVLWSPAIFHPNKPLRVGNQCLHLALEPNDRFCWLASRTPPFSKNPQRGAGSPDRLTIDLTEQLRAALSSGRIEPLQVLYDCRFLLRIDPLRMPTQVKSALDDKLTSINVIPFTQYYWPKVVLRRGYHQDKILETLQESGKATGSSWISIKWVRLLDAV